MVIDADIAYATAIIEDTLKKGNSKHCPKASHFKNIQSVVT